MNRYPRSRTIKHICFLWWWVVVIHFLTNHAFLGVLTLVGGFVMRGEFSHVLEPFAPAALDKVGQGGIAFLWPSTISVVCIVAACLLTAWMLLRKSHVIAVPPPLR